MEHSVVSNRALLKYEYSACWEMLAGALGEIIIVACSCSRWDLLGTYWLLNLVGSSSSSWVIGVYAWRELGGGVTCEKRVGIWYGSLKSVVFFVLQWYTNNTFWRRYVEQNVRIFSWHFLYDLVMDVPLHTCRISIRLIIDQLLNPFPR